ncbi:MAG: YadA C-terminal domain-containing protein [Planctomycetaceae bacterium]|nr:YadA C-terminal domain-containing protein [Planctomycetaceae bacterium]
MVFGTTSNTYTAPGITSAASTAAQTGPRQVVTTDAAGNLAADTPAGLGLATSGQINDLGLGIRENSQGVAMAMALSGIPAVLPRDKSYAISSSWGTFNGENAVSLGGAAAVSENLFLSGGASLNAGTRPTAGGRAGFTYTW